MGADLARGLLEFSEGLPLGESGLKWLRIHLGNLMGRDKLPMNEREEYVLANWNVIEKCVDDPVKNRVWAE
jgi:DNA-directed RNA polymerase